MTSTTSVPKRSNPPTPPRQDIRGLRSLVCAKGIHLGRTRALVSSTRPRGRSLWRPLEPRWPRLGNFPVVLSGPGALSGPGSAHAIP